MKQIKLGKSNLMASQLILGLMRIADKNIREAREIIETAYELGINLYDNADIYGRGKSEELFGQVLKEATFKREDILIQSKVGIRSGFFDFSKDHILKSVDGILKRLNTDYLDILLLHRPDALVEPEEVAEAFDRLEKEGKVLHFGLSNHNPGQVDLLKKFVDQELVINQVQFGPAHTPLIDEGLNVNMTNHLGINRDGGLLNYSRLNEMTLQAWSPFQVNLSEGLFMTHPDYQEMTQLMEEMAKEREVSLEAIVVAWIHRHPANIQTIAGSMNPERIRKMAKASEIELSRQEWYQIYQAGNRELP